jgi:hypothetical protein
MSEQDVGREALDIAHYGLSGRIHPTATPQAPHCCRVSGCLPSANKGKIRSVGCETP